MFCGICVKAMNPSSISFQEGVHIEPASVFRVFTEKLFWEGEQTGKQEQARHRVSYIFVAYFLDRTLNFFKSIY